MKLELERVYFMLVFAAIIGGTVLLLASTSTEMRGYVGPAALHVGEQIGVSAERDNQVDLALLVGDRNQSISPPDGRGHKGGDTNCRKDKYSWQQICVRNWGRSWGG
jgi:hypothetical protein